MTVGVRHGVCRWQRRRRRVRRDAGAHWSRATAAEAAKRRSVRHRWQLVANGGSDHPSSVMSAEPLDAHRSPPAGSGRERGWFIGGSGGSGGQGGDDADSSPGTPWRRRRGRWLERDRRRRGRRVCGGSRRGPTGIGGTATVARGWGRRSPNSRRVPRRRRHGRIRERQRGQRGWYGRHPGKRGGSAVLVGQVVLAGRGGASYTAPAGDDQFPPTVTGAHGGRVVVVAVGATRHRGRRRLRAVT